MSDQEINEAIAKAIGGDLDEAIPNFSASLDACAIFERTLFQTMQGQKYARTVMQTSDAADPWNDSADWLRLITATPRQRCEAFLRMKGLWK